MKNIKKIPFLCFVTPPFFMQGSSFLSFLLLFFGSLYLLYVLVAMAVSLVKKRNVFDKNVKIGLTLSLASIIVPLASMFFLSKMEYSESLTFYPAFYVILATVGIIVSMILAKISHEQRRFKGEVYACIIILLASLCLIGIKSKTSDYKNNDNVNSGTEIQYQECGGTTVL